MKTYTKKQLQALIESYLETFDDMDEYDEYYIKLKELHATGLEGFLEWLKENKK